MATATASRSCSALGCTKMKSLPPVSPTMRGYWPYFGNVSPMVFHIEFRRNLHSFTFSEIPLVLGLLLASPVALIAGRLIGALAYLVIRERQPLRKLTLNMASFLAECAVLLAVFQLFAGTQELGDPAQGIPEIEKHDRPSLGVVIHPSRPKGKARVRFAQ